MKCKYDNRIQKIALIDNLLQLYKTLYFIYHSYIMHLMHANVVLHHSNDMKICLHVCC